jgi:hypothetical protein
VQDNYLYDRTSLATIRAYKRGTNMISPQGLSSPHPEIVKVTLEEVRLSSLTLT